MSDPSRPVRVLYVEDAIDQALLVKAFFNTLKGFAVTHAQDGDSALKLIDIGIPRWRLKGSYAGATGYPQFMPSIVLKLRAARERKRARGERVEGVKPYGTHPAEQAVLDRMRQLRRKAPKAPRPSLAQVAAQLNAEGHRNRAGREWSPQMVHHVLTVSTRL